MDEQTTEAFEEARRQLFDPAVEDEDIRLAKASIKRAQAMRSQAEADIKDAKALKKLAKTLDARIKSQKKWIRTLKEMQRQKVKRQDDIRRIAD